MREDDKEIGGVKYVRVDGDVLAAYLIRFYNGEEFYEANGGTIQFREKRSGVNGEEEAVLTRWTTQYRKYTYPRSLRWIEMMIEGGTWWPKDVRPSAEEQGSQFYNKLFQIGADHINRNRAEKAEKVFEELRDNISLIPTTDGKVSLSIILKLINICEEDVTSIIMQGSVEKTSASIDVVREVPV